MRLPRILGVCCLLSAVPVPPGAAAGADHSLVYLDENDPYYPHRDFPKLVTPQWIGEPEIEAVVVLAIDDMRGHEKWEAYLRPILERLKQIDSRAPVSIMTCQIDPADAHLQQWLGEGLSLETHTFDHPCPLLSKSDFGRARGTYERCVDLLAAVPGNRPVAFRTPCCDSLNTVSPRFYAEIFNRTTPGQNFLSIDSSVFNIFTANDPALPRELVLEADGSERFRKYVPADRAFVNTIEDYPYPYVIGRLCWQFPCVTPSDWSANHFHKPNNPRTVADWRSALDATLLKQGVFDLVFHPHGWIRNDQVVGLIDYAAAKYGRRVKFLTFREALERLQTHLTAGQPLRAADGLDNGVRLIDLNRDGYLDVVIGNEAVRATRVWHPETRRWSDGEPPVQLVHVAADGSRRDAGVHFGAVHTAGTVAALVRGDKETGAWRFDAVKENWVCDPALLHGLEIDGQALATAAVGLDQGVRLRDLDGDGRSELLVGNPRQSAVFQWDETQTAWRKLPFSLPEGTAVVDGRGRDAGLRFIDVDEDGYDDVLFSNEAGYALHLFRSMSEGWSRRVLAGTRPAEGAVPPVVVNGENNGAFFHGRGLWVQNETTDRLKDLVDRRSFGELLKDVEPEARPAAAALASMVPRAGFQVELAAAEPLVMDPVAFAWGADGKLWVVEMADYPRGIDGHGQFGGRVRFLDDSDGDGRYDRSTVFLDGLGYPSGVMPWRGGVLVTCAPEIFYAEDTDGDGKADVRRTLYRGFGEGNQQHRVNGLRWGLDNWVYCANGDSGGEIEAVQTGERMAIGGRDFRIRPDEGLIEPQTGQTQFMREPDDWGNWFGSSNANPMYHFVLDEHYLRRNPHFAPPDPRVQVSRAPGAAPVFPLSRTLPRFNDLNAANRFTSACSAIIYRDELFGPAFYGNSFVCEPVHNLVHREIVTPDGTTFHSRRADDERHSEFLASTDNWSRPVMVRAGPDGALWVADMYRQVIEHPEWIPPEWQERFDLRAGSDKGRIYRVFPVGVPPRAMPRLEGLDTAGLVAALDTPSGWQRDMVQQLLVHRGDRAAGPLLKAMLSDRGKRPLARLHALCTLDGLAALDAETLLAALDDPHPGVVRHAVRLAEPLLDREGELPAAVAKHLTDDDPQVVMQLAYSLGEWHTADAGRALGRLAAERAGDPYLTAAVLSSVNSATLPGLLRVVFEPAGDGTPPAELVGVLLGQAVALDDRDSLAQALAAILRRRGERYEPWQFTALGGLLDGLARRQTSLAEFARGAGEPLRPALAQVNELFAAARRTADDEQLNDAERLAALRLVGRARDGRDADLEVLGRLLTPQTPRDLQSAAVAALGRLEGAKASEVMLAGWPGYSPELRGTVLDALLARDEWCAAILDQIAAGRMPPSEIDATRRRRLLEHPNLALRQRSEKLLAGAINPDRQRVVVEYSAALELTGDATRGAAVFAKSCAACHRLGDVGHAVGPDLAALADRAPQSLLVAVFDPNRAVEAKFVGYTAITTDGRTHTGILASETGASITLLAAEAKQVPLLRADLEQLAGSSKSLMPEGMEKDLSLEAAADLLRYLSGFRPPRKSFPGNEPTVVEAEKLRGEFWLLAGQCEVYGRTLVFEPQYRNLGYWASGDDHAVWTFEVVRPGKYALALDYACDDSTAGQSLALEVAGQQLSFRVAGTGNWDTYRQTRIGAVELPAGKQQLVARPDGALTGPLIDLKAVRLTPVGK